MSANVANWTQVWRVRLSVFFLIRSRRFIPVWENRPEMKLFVESLRKVKSDCIEIMGIYPVNIPSRFWAGKLPSGWSSKRGYFLLGDWPWRQFAPHNRKNTVSAPPSLFPVILSTRPNIFVQNCQRNREAYVISSLHRKKSIWHYGIKSSGHFYNWELIVTTILIQAQGLACGGSLRFSMSAFRTYCVSVAYYPSI